MKENSYLFCKKGKAKKLLIYDLFTIDKKYSQMLKVFGKFETLFTKRVSIKNCYTA